jgi:hypothetical protein
MPRVRTRINIHDTVPPNRSLTVEDPETGKLSAVETDYGFVTIRADYTRDDDHPFNIQKVEFSIV